ARARRLDLHETVVRTGGRALEAEQVARTVALHHTQVLARLARVAVVTAEALALDDLADALAGHRARVAHVHATVRVGTAAEAVALDRAGETAALHRADHVDEVADLERGAEHRVADLGGRGGLESLFAQVALGSDTVLL